MTMDLNELADRAEGQFAPGRIDAEIEYAIGEARVNAMGQTVYRKRSFSPRRYTSSIDAALTLVPEGLSLTLYMHPGEAHCEIFHLHPSKGMVAVADQCATAAIAVTSASLRARKALGAVHTLEGGL